MAGLLSELSRILPFLGAGNEAASPGEWEVQRRCLGAMAGYG
jgi:hypothetical protein